MKKIISSFVISLLFPYFLCFFFLLVLFGGSSAKTESVRVGVLSVSEEVNSYRSLVSYYAERYAIEEYVPYLLAIMQVESGGKGIDVMQSSESKGFASNSFSTVEESIEQGVRFFATNFSIAKEKGLGVKEAVASYNFGTAYLDFLEKNGGYSLELSERYSREVVAVSLGNETGETYVYSNEISKKYGKEYLYKNGGNFYYVELVLQYVSSISVASDFVFPLLDEYIVTAHFGEKRDLILQDGSRLVDVHNGVDLVYRDGRIHGEIVSVGSGTVVFADWRDSGGWSVVVQHSEQLYTYYLHLSEYHVEKGQIVSKGQVIGLMGTTGWSTGEHLHFGASTELFSNYIDSEELLGIYH